MTQTLSAMFDNYNFAVDAVKRLEVAGVPSSDISVVGGDHGMRTVDTPASEGEGSVTGAGTAAGAVIGGGAGLLAGVGMLAIPGVGPVVAAGWLAATLVGAVAGGVAGGIIGALTGLGMSEEDAHTYVEGVRRGGTLVTARVENRLIEKATLILNADGKVDMGARAEAWRTEGWRNPAASMSTPIEPATRSAARDETFASASVPNVPPREDLMPSDMPVRDPVPLRTDQPIHLHDERIVPLDTPAKTVEPARKTEVEVEDERRQAIASGNGTPRR